MGNTYTGKSPVTGDLGNSLADVPSCNRTAFFFFFCGDGGGGRIRKAVSGVTERHLLFFPLHSTQFYGMPAICQALYKISFFESLQNAFTSASLFQFLGSCLCFRPARDTR